MRLHAESHVRIESVRIPKVRDHLGSCKRLADSIERNGLHRPITCWSDGTLISGRRRLFAYMLLDRDTIPTVFVNTIEEAAKRMVGDNDDPALAVTMKWSEACRLFEVLRRLDAPAAAVRLAEARRRGVVLRRKTQAGERQPGRANGRSDDYFLNVISEPFGIKGATARRIETIYHTGHGVIEASDERRELARQIMADVDTGADSIWGGYNRLLKSREQPPRKYTVRPVSTPPAPAEPVAADKQLAAWGRTLPQMEGLTAALIELGAPSPELTWDQVGPIHARFTLVRRELEKMIKQMKEINK